MGWTLSILKCIYPPIRASVTSTLLQHFLWISQAFPPSYIENLLLADFFSISANRSGAFYILFPNNLVHHAIYWAASKHTPSYISSLHRHLKCLGHSFRKILSICRYFLKCPYTYYERICCNKIILKLLVNILKTIIEMLLVCVFYLLSILIIF